MDIENKEIPGACSCMTLTSKTGKHYWFRTCDIDNDIWKEGAHVVHKKVGEKVVYGDGKEEKIAYDYMGMTYNLSDTWVLDGINRWGLTGGLLMLQEGTGVDQADEERDGYIGMELVTKILSSCKNVEQILTLVKRIRVLNIPYKNTVVPPTMHYFFVDSHGNEVILEATDLENPGIFRIFPKEEILGVMTNSPPYEKQMQNLSWFLSQSPEMKQAVKENTLGKLQFEGREIEADEKAEHVSLNGTFPGSFCSHDRFIRLAIMKALNYCGNFFEDEKMLALGSGIMNVVCEPDSQGVFHYTRLDDSGRVIGRKHNYTQYVIMYDIDKLCFYRKKFDEVLWKKYTLDGINERNERLGDCL